MAWFNAILQLMNTILFVIILNTSNLFNSDFVEYFDQAVSDEWVSILKGMAILIYIIAAVYNAFDGFHKAKR